MDHSPPSSSDHGISQARILEWVAISFSRWSCWLRDWSHVSCIDKQIVFCWAIREVLVYYLSSFSGLSRLCLLIIFCMRLSELPRTRAGTATSKILLHASPRPLPGWLERLCLFTARISTSNVVAYGSKTETGNSEAFQKLGPELEQTYFSCILWEKTFHRAYLIKEEKHISLLEGSNSISMKEWEKLSIFIDFLPYSTICTDLFHRSFLKVDIFFSLLSSLM